MANLSGVMNVSPTMELADIRLIQALDIANLGGIQIYRSPDPSKGLSAIYGDGKVDFLSMYYSKKIASHVADLVNAKELDVIKFNGHLTSWYLPTNESTEGYIANYIKPRFGTVYTEPKNPDVISPDNANRQKLHGVGQKLLLKFYDFVHKNHGISIEWEKAFYTHPEEQKVAAK